MAKLDLKIESEISHIEVNVVVKSKMNDVSGSMENQFWIQNIKLKDFEEMLSAKDMKIMLRRVLKGELRPREYESEYKELEDFLNNI